MHGALLLAAVALLAVARVVGSRSPREYVDPIIGTGGLAFGVGGDPPGAQVPFGLVKISPDTTPADPKLWLEFEHYSGAAHMDEYITAFSLLHMVGPGALDLGAIGIMPIGEAACAVVPESGARAAYSHANESATPGHYSVTLTPARATQPITVELTATRHAAIMRLTPVTGAGGGGAAAAPRTLLSVLFDPRHALTDPERTSKDPADRAAKNCSVTVDSRSNTISGHMIDDGGLSGRIPSADSPSLFVPGDASPARGGLDVWFHAVFPDSTLEPSCSGLVEPGSGSLRFANASSGLPDGQLTAAGNTSAFACLPLGEDGSVTIVIGVSTISADHARRNIDVERAASRSFDSLVAAAQAEWDSRLGVVELLEPEQEDEKKEEEGGGDEEALPDSLLVPWWTAMYHTLMAPSTYSEAGGDYLGFDMAVHTLEPPAPGGREDRMLSDMSIWDTHRTWNPLMVLTQPDIATAVVRSLVRMTDEGGALPRWPLAHGYTHCMIGNHAGQIVLDSWRKGIRDFDVERWGLFVKTPPSLQIFN